MNFVDKKLDLSSIIKKYIKDGNEYTIEYLDGTISKYYCTENNHEEKIRSKMLEQAFDRQNKQNMDDLKFKSRSSLFVCTLSTLISLASISSPTISALTLIMALIYMYKCIDSKNKLNELKKYKLFFELMPYLDIINKSDFLKCIEFDNFYQIPLDINTIDELSYSDVKTLYKKFKITNEKNNRE